MKSLNIPFRCFLSRLILILIDRKLDAVSVAAFFVVNDAARSQMVSGSGLV
jgi:hypothetical protein